MGDGLGHHSLFQSQGWGELAANYEILVGSYPSHLSVRWIDTDVIWQAHPQFGNLAGCSWVGSNRHGSALGFKREGSRIRVRALCEEMWH